MIKIQKEIPNSGRRNIRKVAKNVGDTANSAVVDARMYKTIKKGYIYALKGDILSEILDLLVVNLYICAAVEKQLLF